MVRRSTLLSRLRREARATFHALLLLLLVPVLHPVAESFAADGGAGIVICSAFGATSDNGVTPGQADDAPDCLACALTAAGVAPVVQQADDIAFAPFAPAAEHFTPLLRAALIRAAPPRAPPFLS